MAKITKTWSKAGSLPGQYQKLTITFKKRDGSKVKVKWKLYAKSLGYDNYTSRYNLAKIYCLGKTRVTKKYQLRGTHTSHTWSGSFTIGGVKDLDDDLTFYYSNSRHWDGSTNAWDPRSTGVVKKTNIGTLKIPKNKPHDIDFDEVITENEYSYTCFHGKTFKIPNLNIQNHFFDFKGWTTDKYFDFDEENADDLYIDIHESESGGYIVEPFNYNLIDDTNSKSKYDTGKSITVNDDIDLYAVWRSKRCIYNFYDYNNNCINNLTETPLCGRETKLKSLDDLLDSETHGFKCKVPGYKFTRWKCGIGAYYTTDDYCYEWPPDGSSTVKFYPQNEPLENDIIFKLPTEDRTYKYSTDDIFDMSKPLSGYTNISLRPGYKLVGWSTTPLSVVYNETRYGELMSSNGIAYPNKAFSALTYNENKNYYVGSYGLDNNFIVYPISGKSIFEYVPYFKNQTLTLYPYYEYYTTSYVYVDGEWKLAMPYVYKDGEWKMSLSYVYTDGKWKL